MKLSVQLFLCGLALTVLAVFKVIPQFNFVTIAYAYSTQEILNWCYPNSHYDASKTSCDAGSIQSGASCSEDSGGSARTANECGCFGENTSHTYQIIHHPTECNDGSGNIQQFETFECGADLGQIPGQCGNPTTINRGSDCEAPPGDGPQSGTMVCNNVCNTVFNSNGTSSQSCHQVCNCIPKHQASIIPVDANAEYDPQIVSQGEPVNVYVTATRACKDATSDLNNLNFDPGQSLVGCKLTQPFTCDVRNPVDWKKCWAEYQGTAANQVGTFHATFSNSDPACSVDDQYTINPPAQCSSVTRATTTFSNDIVSTTLDDDQKIASMDAQGNLPPSLNEQIITDAQAKDSQTFSPGPQARAANSETKAGVQEGIISSLQSWACGQDSNALVKWAVQSLGFLGDYCPQRVDLAGEKTNLIYEQTGILAQSTVPEGVEPDPASQDCAIQDVPSFNTSQTNTEGNKKINDTDSAEKVIYTEDLPPGVTPPPADTNKSPLTVGGKILNDDRPGDVDNNCPLKMQTLFPDGITRCIDPSSGSTSP